MSDILRNFQTTAAREAFRFDRNAIGRLVTDAQTALTYLVYGEGLGADVLFPLDPSAGGTPDPHAASHEDGGSDPVDILQLDGYPGGTSTFLRADQTFAAAPSAFSPAYYYGESAEDLQWTSTTWDDFTTIASGLTDRDSSNISRSGSDFTVTDAGIYVFDVQADAFNNASTRYLAFRLRRSGVTLAQRSKASEAGSRIATPHLHAVVSLGAADVVTVEYAVSAGFLNYADATIDGENSVTGSIAIYRVS